MGETMMADQTSAGMIAFLSHERKGDCNSSCYESCPKCAAQAIETRLRGLKPDMNELRQVAKNCLARWANPLNKYACDEQLHIPEFYTQIIKAADALDAILGEQAPERTSR
jgi:hypothetical protein